MFFLNWQILYTFNQFCFFYQNTSKSQAQCDISLNPKRRCFSVTLNSLDSWIFRRVRCFYWKVPISNNFHCVSSMIKYIVACSRSSCAVVKERAIVLGGIVSQLFLSLKSSVISTRKRPCGLWLRALSCIFIESIGGFSIDPVAALCSLYVQYVCQ